MTGVPLEKETEMQPQRFLRDIAYEKIKAMLFLNEEAAKAYSERQIAAQLDLGLNPVRSAVERLKLEGLILVVPNTGIILPELSAKAIIDFYEVRDVVESHIVTALTGNLSPSDAARVDQILDEQDVCVQKGNFIDYHSLDMKFHLCLAQIFGNEEMTNMIERLRDRMHRLSTRLHRKYPGRLAANVQQHRDIFEAIKSGDPQRARASIHDHLSWGRSFVLDPRSQAARVDAPNHIG
jgi:DNA-binding GntR family transcriptional regulator